MVSAMPLAASPFVFVGNHRALDFVNTEVATDGALRDLLGDVGDLVAWLEHAGALDHATARRALARWGARRAGDELLAEARELRASLRKLADAAVQERSLSHSNQHR